MHRFAMGDARKSDFDARLSQSAWHTGATFVIGFAVALVARDTFACSVTPEEVYPLLPFSGQADVPLNAVLTLGGSVSTTATFELTRTDNGEAVPLSLPSCEDALCKVAPTIELEPRTSYRYRAGMGNYPTTDWVQFSTGRSRDDAAPQHEEVVVALSSSGTTTEPSCGQFVWATLHVDATLLQSGPVAIVAAGILPSYQSPEAILRAPGHTSLDLRRVSECFTPAIIDTAGHRTPLSQICMSSGMGCSLERHKAGGGDAALIAFAVLALIGLSRCRVHQES